MDYESFYTLAVWRALTLPRPDVCLALTTPPFIALIGVLLRYVRRTRLVLWSMDLYPDIAVVCGMLREGSLLHRLLAAVARFLYGPHFGLDRSATHIAQIVERLGFRSS